MLPFKDTPQIAGLLVWGVSEIDACLGAKIRSVLLFGSAAIGDFGLTDVDLELIRGPLKYHQ